MALGREEPRQLPASGLGELGLFPHNSGPGVSAGVWRGGSGLEDTFQGEQREWEECGAGMGRSRTRLASAKGLGPRWRGGFSSKELTCTRSYTLSSPNPARAHPVHGLPPSLRRAPGKRLPASRNPLAGAPSLALGALGPWNSALRGSQALTAGVPPSPTPRLLPTPHPAPPGCSDTPLGLL